MKHTLLISILLGVFLPGASTQTGDAVSVSADPNPLVASLNLSATTTHHTFAISDGFTDFDFEGSVSMAVADEDQVLTINTDYPGLLQYTVSNLEGIILRKRKFAREDWLDLQRLAPGSYAIYFFAGHRIVKALIVEKKLVDRL